MNVILMRKHMAVTTPVKELVIPGTFDDYYSPENGVNESLLIKQIPADFFPKPARNISVWIEMENKLGSNGQDSTEGLFGDAESWDSVRLLLCR